MKCENCGIDYDKDYRKYPKGKSRFCSRVCANSRIQTKEMNDARSEKLRTREIRYCECGKKLSHNNKSGVCIDCRVTLTDTENKRNFRRKRKELLVEHKGGECELCGYKKSMRSLQFHHLDPEEKEFSLSRPNDPSWERLIKEVEKCILVCANCHGEIHDELDEQRINN